MPTAKIATKQALQTLIQFHAELAGKIDTRRNRNNKWFKQGTKVRVVLTAMKGASGPLTVNDIATRTL